MCDGCEQDKMICFRTFIYDESLDGSIWAELCQECADLYQEGKPLPKDNMEIRSDGENFYI